MTQSITFTFLRAPLGIAKTGKGPTRASPTPTRTHTDRKGASGWLKGLVAPDAVENGGGSTDGELLERLSFGAGSSTRG